MRDSLIVPIQIFIKLPNSEQLWIQHHTATLKYILDYLYDINKEIELNTTIVKITNTFDNTFDNGKGIRYCSINICEDTLSVWKNNQIEYLNITDAVSWKFHFGTFAEFIKNFNVNIKLMPEKLKRLMIEYS